VTTAAFDAMEHRLAELLESEARGPRQNGVFALWLVARAALALMPPDPVSAAGHLARLDEIERRLSSLSLAPPLRRALLTAVTQLRTAGPADAAFALQQLVAPAADTVGRRAADAVHEAARAAAAHAKE
jgi:hypothetical protein